MPCGQEGPACSGNEYFLDVDSIFSGFSLPDGLCSSLTFESVKNMDDSLMQLGGGGCSELSCLEFDSGSFLHGGRKSLPHMDTLLPVQLCDPDIHCHQSPGIDYDRSI